MACPYLPTWLTADKTVILRNFVRSNKHEEFVTELQIMDVNPIFAQVRFPGSRIYKSSQFGAICRPKPSLRPMCIQMVVYNLTFMSKIDHWKQSIPLGNNSVNNSLDGAVQPDAVPADVRQSICANKGTPPDRYGDSVYF